jgi:hypothetical protein
MLNFFGKKLYPLRINAFSSVKEARKIKIKGRKVPSVNRIIKTAANRWNRRSPLDSTTELSLLKTRHDPG